MKVTECVEIQYENWKGHVLIVQIHETLPVAASWFTCQFLHDGKDIPGGNSLLPKERSISRRYTVVPITAVQKESDARRLNRGEDAESCPSIFWRSGFDPENPWAGVSRVSESTLRFLMSSLATSLGFAYVVIQRRAGESLLAVVNLCNI